MQKLFDWFRSNSAGASILGVVLALMLLGTAMKGCALDEMIQISVPRGVQKSAGTPSRVSLAEAVRIFQAQTIEMEAFAKSIEGGYKLMGTIQSFFTAAISQVGTAFPALGLGLTALAGVGGIFIKGPGTAREKNKSYTRGLREGKQIASDIAAALTGTVSG